MNSDSRATPIPLMVLLTHHNHLLPLALVA